MPKLSNLTIYKEDLQKLINTGQALQNSISYECYQDKFKSKVEEELGLEESKKFLKKLPSFTSSYQSWYTESILVIKQLLPDRLNDFLRLYEKPKLRKSIDYENYVIEDYLQGLTITRNNGWEPQKIVGPDAAVPKFIQQLSILKSVKRRFESSLFDIIQLLQADLFDTEIDSAKMLNQNGFFRAAGAVSGVVLEGHLSQICLNHNLTLQKQKPTISDYNDLLKNNNVIELSTWRNIQYLADLRNKCDHKTKNEPTREEISELINGTEKITKTLF